MNKLGRCMMEMPVAAAYKLNQELMSRRLLLTLTQCTREECIALRASVKVSARWQGVLYKRTSPPPYPRIPCYCVMKGAVSLCYGVGGQPHILW